MSNTYEIGDRVRIRTTTPFQDTAGDAFDPDTVTFSVKTPGTAAVDYVYGTDANVTKLATGDFACDLDTETEGTWYYHVTGTTGGVNRGADQGHFSVVRKQAV